MAIVKQHRRGTESAHTSFVGAAGEFTWDTTRQVIVGHDGSTSGGFPMLGAKNNLSDLGSASTARSNLGLGSAAQQADTRYCHRSNNLSDLGSASTSRANLGLTNASADVDFNSVKQNGEQAFSGSVASSPTSIYSKTTGTPDNTWTTVASGAPTGAVAVMVAVNAQHSNVTDNPQVEVSLRRQSGDNAVEAASAEFYESGTFSAKAQGFAIVALDSNGDFQFLANYGSGGDKRLTIKRVGYLYQ
jgi:hypothetical protein